MTMGEYEALSLTQSYQRRCEDRVAILEDSERLILVVADGAGGVGSGDQAAETVIREMTAAKSRATDAESCCAILREVDQRVGAGESTAAIACLSSDTLYGASVGDSQVWLIGEGEIAHLTRNQKRKPLLGTGRSEPVGFTQEPWEGLLILATDGFCNYVKRPELLRRLPNWDFAVLPRKLVELVRLPSGELWDDVGIIVCRRKRPPNAPRRRYEVLAD